MVCMINGENRRHKDRSFTVDNKGGEVDVVCNRCDRRLICVDRMHRRIGR